MESEKQTTERETVPQHLTSYKLIIDPALTKGLYKVYRFDGIRFNIPVSIFIFLLQYSWCLSGFARVIIWLSLVVGGFTSRIGTFGHGQRSTHLQAVEQK